jgi:hypothetical protein
MADDRIIGPTPEALQQQLQDITNAKTGQSLSAILEKFNESFLRATQTEGEGKLIAYTFIAKDGQQYDIRVHREDALKLFYMLWQAKWHYTRVEQQHQQSMAQMQTTLEELKEQRDFYRFEHDKVNAEIRQLEQQIHQQQQAQRKCEICGKSLAGKRADATTCGAACRNEKKRRRQKKN